MKIVVRSLLKSPGFTLIALITLALGIGVNTTAFSVMNRLLFFSQPFPEPERLVQVWSTVPQWQNGPVSPAAFGDIRDQNTVFEQVALYYANQQKSVTRDGKSAERVTGMDVTVDFFSTLEIPALFGRTFSHEDAGRGEAPVILSHAYWQKHYAGDASVVGRTLRYDSSTSTIIGVMPPVLDDPQIWNGRIDLWHLENLIQNRNVRNRSWHSMIARLKPGATTEQADVEMKAIAARLAVDFPRTNEQQGLRATAYSPDYMGEVGRSLMWLVMALSGTVLLIACVNLANLQLVRATGHSREYAIRLALGASRTQLMRLLLTESLLLAFVGGILGLLVAKWSNSYFATFFDSPMPLDLRVLGFALIASGVTGVAFGAIPAWIGSRSDVNSALKQSGRGATTDRARYRFRQTLIIAELALALMLLSGAGYFVRGIQRIMVRELHWHPENVLIGTFELPYMRYGDETNIRHAVFTDKFIAALKHVPGVDHAALSFGTPAQGPAGGIAVVLEGQPPPAPGQESVATLDAVTPDFLATYGMRLLRGRNFLETDHQGTPAVAIVNNAMAEKFWPGEDPVGHRFTNADPQNPQLYEVIGVVSDSVFGYDFTGQYPRYHFYEPWAQHSRRFPTLSVHSTTDVRTLGDNVRKALAGIEPDLAITRLTTAEEMLKTNVSGYALISRTLAQLAGLGLLLAVVGIYGVIANLTSERTQEIGVRMALGAQERDIVWLFLRNGILLAGLGTAIGLGLSFSLLHILGRRVSQMPGNDPWMVIGVAVFLAVVAVFACWLPARRATKVHPVVALRAE